MSKVLERTSFDTPILPRLGTIINDIQAGLYSIPIFERPYVWNDDQRLALLDSIIKGLPIGSILVWRTDRYILKSYSSIAGIPIPPVSSIPGKKTYLIDGHQRISTLFGALVRTSMPHIEQDYQKWPIYYELGTSESPAFQLPPRRSSPPPHWLPLDILFEGRTLFQFITTLYQAGEDEKAEEAERLSNIFKDYIIPIVPLVTDNIDIVTDAFVRINSQGTSMSEAHMLRALTYLKDGTGPDQGFDRIYRILEPLGWEDIPDQLFVNCLKAILDLDVYRSSVIELNFYLQREPDTLLILEKALREAVEFLRDLGVRGWSALPYAYQLVTLTTLAARNPDTLRIRRDVLHDWFWRATYTEHFTGQKGGQIRQEINLLTNIEDERALGIATETEILPLEALRRGTVRTKAFLLFLASMPADRSSRERRQEALALKDTRIAASLFPNRPASDPGNVVIAQPTELRVLRAILRQGPPAPDQADEFVFPESAIRCLPDVDAFLQARREYLLHQEAEFIHDLGLSIQTSLDEVDVRDL